MDRIGQVLRNLLSNSVKFTKPGKQICIKADFDSADINDSMRQVVKVSVIDQGIGIPPGERGSIFGKFIQSSRTKTGAGGTGLGLAICKQIIEDQNGIIEGENNADGGALFYFLLPCS